MTNFPFWLVLLALLLVGVGAYGWVKWFKVFNSQDGERYARRLTQGPLVPLSPAEIAADEARRAGRPAP